MRGISLHASIVGLYVRSLSCLYEAIYIDIKHVSALMTKSRNRQTNELLVEREACYGLNESLPDPVCCLSS